MRLVALKSTTHFNKWRADPTSKSLRFSVVSTDSDYLEIGTDYVFSSQRNLRTAVRERRAVQGEVSLTAAPDVLSNIRPLFFEHPRENDLIGMVSFYPEGEPGFGYMPALINFMVIVEPWVLKEMSRQEGFGPGALTFDLRVDGLESGWEPDGSHTVWKLLDDKRSHLPITSFSCAIETHRTTESEIFSTNERYEIAELSGSFDPGARALAKQFQDDQEIAPTERYLKELRLLMLAIFVMLLAIVLRSA